MNIDELNIKIKEWAVIRDINNKGTIKGQAIKTIEEMSELIKGICKNDIDLIKDSIGDVYVTLVIGCMLNDNRICENYMNDGGRFRDRERMLRMLADEIVNISSCDEPYEYFYVVKVVKLLELIAVEYDTTLEECVNLAYDEISSRKGKMVDGVFVKEEDLKKHD